MYWLAVLSVVNTVLSINYSVYGAFADGGFDSLGGEQQAAEGLDQVAGGGDDFTQEQVGGVNHGM